MFRLPWRAASPLIARSSTRAFSAAPTELRVERLVEPHAGVTIVTLDRPAARNSLGKNLLGELQDAVAALHHDRETRV
eukprot:CAMPEP_0119540692 /NCGR_PEP_ID=MMETSP1344-20130328/52497_1 /TAXON_ID=236787 /ORGANISM="Florenciella parvula, Strain CCMP2471" /LENGTH=77 /DNA_ID=CAMNT_0007584503 /DNA_START=24 /DNA_END=253 /DNA_ORIENTATION=+